MHQIAFIFVCLGIGVVLRWSGRLPDTANKGAVRMGDQRCPAGGRPAQRA